MAENQNTTDQEIWKDIPGFPGYQASNTGEIRSFWVHRKHKLKETPKILKHWNRGGYRCIELCVNKVRILEAVHRLVLIAFNGIPLPGQECLHGDGVRINNNVKNLRWGTRSENLYDSVKHGTHTHHPGSTNHNAKLSEAQALEIINLRRKGVSAKELKAMYGVHRNTIYRILNGTGWKHVR